MLRRTKTIVFRDDLQPDDDDAGLDARPSLRRESPLRDTASADDLASAASGANERLTFLRTELDENPISKGSPHSLEALRAEFQRTLASRLEEPVPTTTRTLPGFLRPSRILLILVAVMAGGAAAFLATQRPEAVPPPAVVEVAAPAAAAPVEVPMFKVLVASQDIPVGGRLTPEALVWQDWPEAALRSDYIVEDATPEAIADMGEFVARIPFVGGEPIRQEKLGRVGEGYLSAILESGKRGVSVNVKADSASGGFIVPNDHVDVVLTRQTTTGQVAQTILTNVRVVAINAQLGEQGAGGEVTATPEQGLFTDAAIATLELDPVQSELLINAGTMGTLSLMLRPVADTSLPASTGESAANQAIRLTSPFWNSPQIR